jgi:hypothetical protein
VTIDPRDLEAAQNRDDAIEARCLSLAKP